VIAPVPLTSNQTSNRTTAITAQNAVRPNPAASGAASCITPYRLRTAAVTSSTSMTATVIAAHLGKRTDQPLARLSSARQAKRHRLHQHRQIQEFGEEPAPFAIGRQGSEQRAGVHHQQHLQPDAGLAQVRQTGQRGVSPYTSRLAQLPFTYDFPVFLPHVLPTDMATRL
jgi:hypothetical protein